MQRKVYIFFCTILWIYIGLRAYFVPIMHDEAATMFFYVHTGKFIPFFSHWDANNHMLNSLLSRLSYLCFGDDLWALRLPNVLAALVLFYFVWKISAEFQSVFLKWFFLVLMLMSQTFMEFFALSRGYGLSMSLLMASLWYYIQYVKYERNKLLLLCLLMMSFAVSANLTLLISDFIIIGIFIIHLISQYFSHKKSVKKPMIICFIFGVFPTGLFILFLYFLKKFGLLYYGSMEGLLEGTLDSMLFHFTGYTDIWAARYVVFISILLLLIPVFFAITKYRLWFSDPSAIFIFLFAGNLLSVFMLNLIFGNPYHQDRTALYFYPYLVGGLLFFINFIHKRVSLYYSIFLILPFIFIPLQFLAKLNLSHCTLWPKDAIPNKFFDYIYEDARASGKFITVGGTSMRSLCWSYSNFKSGGKLGQIQGANYPSVFEDYQIFNTDTLPDIPKYYSLVFKDSYSGLKLLKRRIPAGLEEVAIWDTLPAKVNTSDENYNFFELQMDSLKLHDLEMDFRFNLDTKTSPFEAWIVFAIYDENNKVLRYQYIALERLKLKWENEAFHSRMLAVNLPIKGEKMFCYLWNVKKETYSIRDVHVSLSALIK
jgi:hypothetical protein